MRELCIQITKAQAEKLRKLAYERKRSQAQIVRDALDAFGIFKIDSVMLAHDGGISVADANRRMADILKEDADAKPV